jgi:hypothetical protein
VGSVGGGVDMQLVAANTHASAPRQVMAQM